MDILKLIKERRTIRRYKDKPVPEKAVDKIIEAGRWGPSIPSFLRIQPWRFVVVRNIEVKDRISKLILQKSKDSGAGVNILLRSAGNIIGSAGVMVLVYSSGDMKRLQKKYKEIYSRFSAIIEKAELSAISAAIQNMILTAEDLGVGSCWLDTPLFCKKEISELVEEKEDLLAVLTFGAPAEEGRRASRKPITEAVRYID